MLQKSTIPNVSGDSREELRRQVLKEIDEAETKEIKKEPESVTPPPQPQVNSSLKTRLLKHRFRIRLVVIVPVIVVLLYVLLFVTRTDRFVAQAAQFLPWPVAVIDGHIIWYSDFSREVDTYRRLTVKSGELPTPTLEKLALERLVEVQLVRDEITNTNLEVSDESVNEETGALTKQFNSQNSLEQYLSETYGWSLSDLRDRMVRPYLERFKLVQYLNEDPQANIHTKGLAGEVRQKIVNKEISFEDAARQYSSDSTTSETGGDLGWFTWGTMVPQFEGALKQMKVGDISEPVQTPFGYHLIRLDGLDTPKDESAMGSIKASHILFQVANYQDWFTKRRSSTQVVKLLPIGG